MTTNIRNSMFKIISRQGHVPFMSTSHRATSLAYSHSTAATFSTQSDMASQLFKKSISDAPRQTRRVCLRGFRWFANCLYMGMTSAAKLPVQCNSKPHMVRCNAPGLLQIAALVLQAEGTTVEKGIVRKSFQQTCDIRITIAVPSKVLWPLKSAGNLCW